MEWLATLITPPGGTVLDPFAGSGTTGQACRNKDFSCVLVEREDEYVRDICNRLSIKPQGAAVALTHAERLRLVAELQARINTRLKARNAA